MYNRLKSSKRNKIVIIGNSNIAFGIDSALIEAELESDDLDYDVINFGLYGAIGTVAMLDLSEKYINEGDIVIFSPEYEQQSLSMFFSATEFWRAADVNRSMLTDLSSERIEAIVGNYISFVAEKQKYNLKGKSISTGDLYSKASFNDRCDMKNAERAQNIMLRGVDSNNPIVLEINLLQDDFVEYVNKYYANILNKNAQMFYSFAPMNVLSLQDRSSLAVQTFYNCINDSFDFPIISDPNAYIMDCEWFYDSNFHLNQSGMTIRTVNLINDIKNQLGITSGVNIVLPDKPSLPTENQVAVGDNADISCFLYEETADSYEIVGLTDVGKQRKQLLIPSSYNEKTIKTFSPEVFRDNITIEEITIQSNITFLANYSFVGCSNLKKLIILQNNPNKIQVGYYLIKSADLCKIYVSADTFAAFDNHYFWGSYKGKYETY